MNIWIILLICLGGIVALAGLVFLGFLAYIGWQFVRSMDRWFWR